MYMRVKRQPRPSSKRKEPPFLETLILYAILFVAAELLRPKPQIENAKPAGLGEFKFPTATEGRSVPLIWGTVRIDGPNVVWYGDLIQEAITEEVKTGMFSSTDVTKGYKYKVGAQYALCRGEVDSLHGFWVGDDRVFTGTVTDGNNFFIDEEELFGGDDLGNGGYVGRFKFHAGSASQAVSTYLAEFQLEGGDTPGYNGTCYIAPNAQPTYVGNSTSIKPIKIELRREANVLGLSGGDELVNGTDANPMNVIYEIMTDTDWGLGYATAAIDSTNFTTASATLATEGNGVSMIIDNALEAAQVIRLVEEQIDGVVFFNQKENTWQVKLARSDYTVGALDPINETNSKLMSYSRGAWENTTNAVRVQYNDASDEYKQTYAVAQDTANVRIQNDINVSVTKAYPGVKNATLANSIAWRDLRALSYPLAKAKVVVDRSFWDVNVGDVFRFNNTYLGITDLAMRVTRIDFGELDNNKITLDLVQDVFYTEDPSYGDPTATGWDDPHGTLAAFASDEQMAIEAPRALVRRDPVTGGTLLNKVFAAARQSGVVSIFDIRQRNAAGVPSGDYTVSGEVTQLVKIGELNAALTTKSAYPLTSLVINSTPDSQDDLIAAFLANAATNNQLGVELVNLILINDEFMLVESVQTTGGNVQLDNVYRGVLDSVQADHAINDEVFVLMSGAGLNTDDIPETNQVDVKLVPRNLGGALAEASATTINFTMDKRIRRPYPPSEISLNTVAWDTTAVDLEANGSGPEDYHADVDFTRRDYRVADNLNELAQLGTDANSLYSDFPTNNSTDHNIEVRHDPSGTNDLINTVTGQSGTNYSLNQIDILQALNGAVPTGDIRVNITARHTDGGDTLTSRQTLSHDFVISTTLTGQFEFGLLSLNETSALYTATVNGTYSFTLSSAFTAGAVEYRLNGGTWTSLIAAGLTTGSIVGVVSTDTIEVRHTSSDASILKQLDMVAAGAGQDGFAVLEN